MEDSIDLERIYNELVSSTSKEIVETLGEYKTKQLIIRIIDSLKGAKWLKNIDITEFKMTTMENKNGERFFFIRASFLRKGICQIDYFAFDSEGNYLGCVKTGLCNVIPLHQVEMEYWANQKHANKGNMTVLAKEVIKEIFEDRILDGISLRKDSELSNIDTIMVSINKDNYPSLAVARKLGFDEKGYLHLDTYQMSGSESTR